MWSDKLDKTLKGESEQNKNKNYSPLPFESKSNNAVGN